MLKTFFFKLAQGILIIALVCAGGFVFAEESAEKTEKTEQSEEALHRSYYSNTAKRSPASKQQNQTNVKDRVSHSQEIPGSQKEVLSDFNVNYIYTTSYLDQ